MSSIQPTLIRFPAPTPSTSSSSSPSTIHLLRPTSASFSTLQSALPRKASPRSDDFGGGLGRRRRGRRSITFISALGKLSETELVSVPDSPEELAGKIPSGAGIYGIYDANDELQFVGITRSIAGSVASHRKSLPQLCCSVKVGLVDEPAPDRAVLTDAWKSWMQEHLEATGRVPPGNESGNNTWLRQPKKKPDIRLTPGRHVKLTVPLEDLIDRLVKETRVVAFIKGSRHSPQCGFSQKVVGILESQGVDFECVDVLDEEYNSGLREKLKSYSNWPTFPQIFVKGELLGGCDILSTMEEKGELGVLLEK